MTTENLTHDLLEDLHMKVSKLNPETEEFKNAIEAIEKLSTIELKLYESETNAQVEKERILLDKRREKREKLTTAIQIALKIVGGTATAAFTLFMMAYGASLEDERILSKTFVRNAFRDAWSVATKGKK